MFLIMFGKMNKNRNCQLFRKIIFLKKERLELKKTHKANIIDLTQMPFVGPFVISLLVSAFQSLRPLLRSCLASVQLSAMQYSQQAVIAHIKMFYLL